MAFPPCPQSLKPIQHYLKTAAELEQRDIVVTYWCRLYAMQTALKIDKKSDDAKVLLVALMDWLEKTKNSLKDNDAITNDVAAQAHLENYALKLFTWADSQDRSGVFNKNVVKAFYTAGMIMDVLEIFGEQTDEIARNCKYAKWKAAYIHNCLKNGETPIPGPMKSENDNEFDNANENQPTNPSLNAGPQFSNSNFDTTNEEPSFFRTENLPPEVVNPTPVVPPPRTSVPAVSPTIPYNPPADNQSVNSGVKLNPALIAKAQKYCKFAGSALNYDDVAEAINNLEKALRLLRTGQDA